MSQDRRVHRSQLHPHLAMVSLYVLHKTSFIYLGFINLTCVNLSYSSGQGAVQKNARWAGAFTSAEICRKETWCNPDKCSCNGDQIEIVTGEVGGSPRKKLTALSVSVNWSSENFLFVHHESSWQYFSAASTIKCNFHCHYFGKDLKCAHFTPEFLQLGPCLCRYLS